MDWRHVIAGGLLVIGALISGSPFVLGDGSGTETGIEEFSVSVTLNDDFGGDVPQGTPATCAGVGIPPGHLVVTFEGAVNDASTGLLPATVTYRLTIGLGPHTATRTLNVSDGGYRRLNSSVVFPDDDVFASGDRATVNVSLHDDDNTVDTVTRTTPVTAQNLTCAADDA